MAERAGKGLPNMPNTQNATTPRVSQSNLSSRVSRDALRTFSTALSPASQTETDLVPTQDATGESARPKRGRPRTMHYPQPGGRYGELTFVSAATDLGYKRRANVICDCGASKVIRLNDWGVVISCGCRKFRGHTRRHGDWRSKEYQLWTGMISRCTNENAESYPNYGGRGITVCESWRDYANFLADMGRRPSPDHQLDRYPNNDGNYEPGNVRWATRAEQAVNKRHTVRITAFGETLNVYEWAERFGRKPKTILNRLRLGFTAEAAVSAVLYAPAVRQ
jgi:hypothetical protein